MFHRQLMLFRRCPITRFVLFLWKHRHFCFLFHAALSR